MADQDKPTSPGELLAAELAHRGRHAIWLAFEMNCSLADVEALIAGTKPVTPDVAAALERALGIDAGLWAHLRTEYEADLARLGQ